MTGNEFLITPEEENNPSRALVNLYADHASGQVRIEPPFFVDEDVLTHWREQTGIIFSNLRVGHAATRLFFSVEKLEADEDSQAIIKGAMRYVMFDVGDLAIPHLIKDKDE